ncbi:DUF7521 family protein [Halegenticoccus soli]|uniref:DUF7521 family protein n=1 Tax=Halegenticoccus soli TaxID=1985678 RepID=UPI000C6D5D34|nr:hypothetical protein [Halegenticoccus soli]
MHLGLVVAKLLVVGLGLAIALQGYRGYRRYDDRPMLFVAGGFALVSVGSILEGVLYDVLGWSIFVAGMSQSLLVALGMALVLYSLYGRSS